MALKLRDLAAQIGGEVAGDGETPIERVAPIETAGPGDITFVSNLKYMPFASSTRASAIIIAPQLRHLQRGATPREEQEYAAWVGKLRATRHNLLLSPNPYLAFAKSVGVLMYRPLPRTTGVHPTAIVAPSARLGKDVSIGPRVTIEDGVELGDRVTIHAGVYVGHGVVIGNDTTVYPNATLYRNIRIGERCVIHANVSIGSEGFGWVHDGRQFVAIPQVGITVVHDDVSIGAGTVINRGALGNTSIGRGTKIDSLVVISHNVEIGEDCLFVSQVGISGSVKIGNRCRFGGQAGVAGHLKITDDVDIAAQSGVSHNLDVKGTYFGSPARPIGETKRTLAALSRLPELRDEIRHVRNRMEQITALLDKDVKEDRQAADDKAPKPAPAARPATAPAAVPAAEKEDDEDE